MLAETMQEFMGKLTSWLPAKLEHPAEILLYFAILGTMSVVPLLVWLGWAVASTDTEQRG
jgi:hypothetical protein